MSPVSLLPSFGSLLALRRFLPALAAVSLALRQSCRLTGAVHPHGSGRWNQQARHPWFQRSPRHFSFGCLLFCGVASFLGRKTSICLLPFASMRAFGRSCLAATRCGVPPVFSSITVTSFHWPGVNHYYGVVCHPTPHSPILAFPLVWDYPCGMMPGFPR